MSRTIKTPGILTTYYPESYLREIRNALKKIGLPTTSKEWEILKKKIIKALIQTSEITPGRFIIGGENRLIKEAVRKIAKTTSVI